MHNPVDYRPNEKRQKKETNQIRNEALKKRSVHLLHKLVKAEIGNYFTVRRPEKDKNFPLTFYLPYGDDSENGKDKLQANGSCRDEELNRLAEKLKIMLFSK